MNSVRFSMVVLFISILGTFSVAHASLGDDKTEAGSADCLVCRPDTPNGPNFPVSTKNSNSDITGVPKVQSANLPLGNGSSGIVNEPSGLSTRKTNW